LRTGIKKVVLRGGRDAHYVASGHLLYVAAGTLRAIPFDLDRLETHGTAVPVLASLGVTNVGAGDFAVSTDGTLVYLDVRGTPGTAVRSLVWVDRMGHEEPLAAEPRAYEHPRLSPDETKIAVTSADQARDIYIWDLIRSRLRNLTLDPSEDRFPSWRNGHQIVFSSSRGDGQVHLWSQEVDGTGAAEPLTTNGNLQVVTGITTDGATAIYSELTPSMGRDLMEVALDGTRRVTPLLSTEFEERNGTVSPDNHWLAYESNRSGSFDIYVRPFPNVGGREFPVSTAGGRQPLWSRDGKELFYFGPDNALMDAAVEASGATWSAGTPVKLLEPRYYTGTGTGRAYDVSKDGHFLMIKGPAGDSPAASPSIIVVQHFDDELKRLVPTN